MTEIIGNAEIYSQYIDMLDGFDGKVQGSSAFDASVNTPSRGYYSESANFGDFGGTDYGGEHSGSGGVGDYGGGSNGYGGNRPIILDLDDIGIKITELSKSTVFMDASGDGLSNRTAWAAAGNGVLFYDPNNTGEITEKRQFVFTEWDPTATNDLEARECATFC
jgi:hypothetical protein